MKNKLERFRIVAERANVLEPGKELFERVKGRWNADYFGNENPITVELACGRGEYSVALAKMFPSRNYVGVDIKGDRIWKGSTLAIEQNLSNIGFLRTNILNIDFFFAEHEIDEIWLTFADPRPKKRDVKRRLTNSRFLDMYKKLLRPGGIFRFKTDNTGLFQYTLDELRQRNDIDELVFTEDVYQSPLQPECYDIKTRYEEMFASQGEKIKYLRFRFR
ncbi:MAG TPA: tRNA (guanosine(46)-N7)-methyltransferase TrmB [Cyclobacteriaceae bacterium]|nr:tRNA (guanosine(46)-N7)-methyltransferase TrmB [Cyclobacteriaceae bacterium]